MVESYICVLSSYHTHTIQEYSTLRHGLLLIGCFFLFHPNLKFAKVCAQCCVRTTVAMGMGHDYNYTR